MRGCPGTVCASRCSVRCAFATRPGAMWHRRACCSCACWRCWSCAGGSWSRQTQLPRCCGPTRCRTTQRRLCRTTCCGCGAGCQMVWSSRSVRATGSTQHRVRVDADRLVELLGAEPGVADGELSQILAAWNGGAYPELDELDEARVEAARLEELRQRAREVVAAARLAAGDLDGLVTELVVLAEADPLRERPRELLMAALAASGRTVEALRSFDDFRRLLGDELGIEPSPTLIAQHAALLAGTEHDRPPPGSQPIAVPGDAAHRARAVAGGAGGAGRGAAVDHAGRARWRGKDASARRARSPHPGATTGSTRWCCASSPRPTPRRLPTS